MLAVAERVVWFKPPRETLADPIHFLAHVMTYGTVADLRATCAVIGPDEFSWAYWNLKYGRDPAPPLPIRRL